MRIIILLIVFLFLKNNVKGQLIWENVLDADMKCIDLVQNMVNGNGITSYAWAVGRDGLFYTSNGGESWTSLDYYDIPEVKSLYANNQYLASVLACSGNYGCFLGVSSDLGVTQEITLQYPDTLNQFTSFDSKFWHFQTGEQILGIAGPICIASEYAIGTWVPSEVNPNYFVLNSYYGGEDMYISDMASSDHAPNEIVAVGCNGLILKSVDQGVSWSDISIEINDCFTNVAFAQSGRYYLTTFSNAIYVVDYLGNILEMDEEGPDNGGPLSKSTGTSIWSGDNSWATNSQANDWRSAGSNYFSFNGFKDMEMLDASYVFGVSELGVFKLRTSILGIPCGDRNFNGFIENNLGERAGDANNNGEIDNYFNAFNVVVWSEFSGDVNCNNILDPGEFWGDRNGDGIINGNEIMGDRSGDAEISAFYGEIAGDINGNGIIDETELAGDVNGDGFINDDELSGDSNGDGLINFNELAGDNNGDGFINGYELLGDINGNSIYDMNEVIGDINGNRVIDGNEVLGDSNGDGIADMQSVEFFSASKMRCFYIASIDMIVITDVPVSSKYTLYGSKGQIIKSGSIDSTREQIDTRNLSPGIYYIEINHGDKRLGVRRLFVSH